MHEEDFHMIYWNQSKAWSWIQPSYQFVSKDEQKFQFKNGDGIWAILKEYVPEKPDNDTIMKFGTPMFPIEICGQNCRRSL